jgi:hypothetical protein
MERYAVARSKPTLQAWPKSEKLWPTGSDARPVKRRRAKGNATPQEEKEK